MEILVTESYSVILLKVLIGFLLGYIIATLVESFIHQYVFHAKWKCLIKWKRYPYLFEYLIRTYYSHHVVHHCRTYKQNFVTQFRNFQEQQELDKELESKGKDGQNIKNSGYGVKLHGFGAIVFISPLLPGIPLTLTLLGTSGLYGGLFAMVLPALLTNFVHPYLHMPHEKAVSSAPFPLSLLLQTNYFRVIARNHFLHHRYIMCNFNLLLGGDILRGVSLKSNEKDFDEMRRAGIRLD